MWTSLRRPLLFCLPHQCKKVFGPHSGHLAATFSGSLLSSLSCREARSLLDAQGLSFSLALDFQPLRFGGHLNGVDSVPQLRPDFATTPATGSPEGIQGDISTNIYHHYQQNTVFLCTINFNIKRKRCRNLAITWQRLLPGKALQKCLQLKQKKNLMSE